MLNRYFYSNATQWFIPLLSIGVMLSLYGGDVDKVWIVSSGRWIGWSALMLGLIVGGMKYFKAVNNGTVKDFFLASRTGKSIELSVLMLYLVLRFLIARFADDWITGLFNMYVVPLLVLSVIIVGIFRNVKSYRSFNRGESDC